MNEKAFEDKICEELKELGWKEITNNDFKRQDCREMFNFDLLEKQIEKINPNYKNENVAKKAIAEIKKVSESSLEEINKKGMKFLTEGVRVTINSKGNKNLEQNEQNVFINLISNNEEENIYQFFRQFEVSNGEKLRKPDITLFLNGLPICVMELKFNNINGINDAFRQNETLKQDKKELWMFNVINFISNAIETKYGSTTEKNIKKFHSLNSRLNSKNGEIKENYIHFLFNKKRIIKIINLFTFYSDDQKSIKYLAAPYQIRAVENTLQTLKNSKDNKGGIVWHTQGSGKSVTMVFLTKAIMQEYKKSTVLLVTDRNDLETQLYTKFLNAKTYLRNEPKKILNRKTLENQLYNKQHFGIFFIMVQKFAIETGLLSKRDDIFLLVDEAHRSQNNIDSEIKIDKKTKKIIEAYGYAKFMRKAFPCAKLVGFNGTPLMGRRTKYKRLFWRL